MELQVSWLQPLCFTPSSVAFAKQMKRSLPLVDYDSDSEKECEIVVSTKKRCQVHLFPPALTLITFGELAGSCLLSLRLWLDQSPKIILLYIKVVLGQRHTSMANLLLMFTFLFPSIPLLLCRSSVTRFLKEPRRLLKSSIQYLRRRIQILIKVTWGTKMSCTFHCQGRFTFEHIREQSWSRLFGRLQSLMLGKFQFFASSLATLADIQSLQFQRIFCNLFWTTEWRENPNFPNNRAGCWAPWGNGLVVILVHHYWSNNACFSR